MKKQTRGSMTPARCPKGIVIGYTKMIPMTTGDSDTALAIGCYDLDERQIGVQTSPNEANRVIRYWFEQVQSLGFNPLMQKDYAAAQAKAQ